MKRTRERFRRIANASPMSALGTLLELRLQVAPQQYESLISAFRTTAPKHRALPVRTIARFEDLLWWPTAAPLTVDGELAWAVPWLKPATHRINRHLAVQHELQHLLLQGDFAKMLDLLHKHVQEAGWSVGACEVVFAATARAHGREALRELEKTHQKDFANRASALLASIFADRNDPALSFDAFTAKCRASFPRYTQAWLRAYLPYCAIGKIESPATDLPLILARELTSSLFDYYEALVTLLQRVSFDPSLSTSRDGAIQTVHELIAAGIADVRLRRLLERENHNVPEQLESPKIGDVAVAVLKRSTGLLTEAPTGAPSGFSRDLHDTISHVEREGSAAPESIANLVSLAIAFKALPVGRVIGAKAALVTSVLAEGPVLPEGSELLSGGWLVEHLLLGADAEVERRLRHAAETQPASAVLAATKRVMDGDAPADDYTEHPLIAVWLVRHLVVSGRDAHANALVQILKQNANVPERHISKLSILGDAREGRIESALNTAAALLTQNRRYATELPLASIFRGRKWGDFKNLDPVLVAVVADHANEAWPDSNQRFICRMACRAFYLSQQHRSLDFQWDSAPGEGHRRLLLAFLRDVWADDNLVLVDKLTSTQELRRERIRVFQHLLAWDPKLAPDYSAAIKELTLDETLSRGLQQIDETRFFVNESAISRWAEKELLTDFERWLVMANEAPSDVATDDLLRKYLIDPNIDALLDALPKTQATQANTILLSLLDRLLKRFLTDPLDGLNSYLSLRIRHGSLRGALLGPLEQSGLLINGEYAARKFRDQWEESFRSASEELDATLEALSQFTVHVQRYVKDLIDQAIQVNSDDHPNGLIPSAFDPKRVPAILATVSAPLTFSGFLTHSYTLFWLMLGPAR